MGGLKSLFCSSSAGVLEPWVGEQTPKCPLSPFPLSEVSLAQLLPVKGMWPPQPGSWGMALASSSGSWKPTSVLLLPHNKGSHVHGAQFC